MHVFAFCVLLVQAGASAAMPPQPDFSGRWAFVAAVPTDPSIATGLNVRQPVMRTNPRGEPTAPSFLIIEIERQLGARTISETHWIGVVGGTVGGIGAAERNARPMRPPTRSHHAVAWDGSTLVFEHGTSTGDGWHTGAWTEYRETWALQPNGELAIMIATSGSTNRTRTVSATYRRRD